MSARASIKDALVLKFKDINGGQPFLSNLYGNVLGKLRYWNEVPDYPYLCCTVGNEVREYLPGGFKWGLLNIPLWVYVKGSDSEQLLENVFTDIEYIVDNNQTLEYETGKFIEDMRIISLTTDEGLMEPLRIGEVLLQIRYGV